MGEALPGFAPAEDATEVTLPPAQEPATDAAPPPPGASHGSAPDDPAAPGNGTWWAPGQPGPADLPPTGRRRHGGQTDSAETMADLLDLTADDVHRRLRRASDMARIIVQDARQESAALLQHARASADRILQSAQNQARQELDDARREADAVLRRAHDQLRATLAAAETVDAQRAVQPHEDRRSAVNHLLEERASLATRLRALDADLLRTLDHASVEQPTVVQPAAVPAALPAAAPAAPTVPAAPVERTEPADPAVPAEPGAVPGRRGAWGRLVYRARKVVLVVTLLVAVASAVWGPAVVSSLSNGGFSVIGSESDRATQRVAATVGRQGADVVALYTSSSGTVDDERFRAAVQQVYDRIPAAGVASKASYWSTNQAPAFVSKDRRSTYIAVRLTGDEDQRLARFAELERGLRIDPGVGTTRLGGVTAVDHQINDQVSADLTKAETISAPLLGILLVLVFASVVAAGLPLLIGGLTVVVSFVVLRALAEVTDVSVFAVNIVTVLGLGLAIDYALLVVSRFREEQAAGHDTQEALARTMTTAGRSIAVSAVTVAASLTGLLFFPVVFLRSMAYGGVAAVLIAAVGSLTVLPALIGVLGHRVNAWRVPLPRLRRRPREDDDPFGPAPVLPAATDGVVARPGRWERLALSVMRRPVTYTLAVSVVLLALAAPVLHVRFGGVDARQLPASADGRVVTERLAADFAGVQLEPVDVLVDGGGSAAADTVRRQIEALPNVRGVSVAATRDASTLLSVDYPGAAVDAQARSLVTAIRDLPAPTGSRVLVGGATAQHVDLKASIGAGLWKMALLTVAVTFLLLFWAFGSVVLPLKAIFMNVLSVSAALGVVVLVFQDGWLSGPLGFTSTGFVELTQPILVLAILFGVSTDYEVFLLSRIRERWDATHDNVASVAAGVQRTGPIITSAAVLILVVIAAFSTSQITFIKLIGVGMFVAILLDATVVRALLVPATMRLMGRWNWWAPGPLLRWWERHRPASEELDA